jgi:signal transduction histidine kinase
MGVGLLVAKAIINANHGDISIDSKGDGKTVVATITLPVVN